MKRFFISFLFCLSLLGLYSVSAYDGTTPNSILLYNGSRNVYQYYLFDDSSDVYYLDGYNWQKVVAYYYNNEIRIYGGNYQASKESTNTPNFTLSISGTHSVKKSFTVSVTMIPIFNNVIDASLYSTGGDYNLDNLVLGSIPDNYSSGYSDYVATVKNFGIGFSFNLDAYSSGRYASGTLYLRNELNDLPPIRRHHISIMLGLPSKESLLSWLNENNIPYSGDSFDIITRLQLIRSSNRSLRYNNSLAYNSTVFEYSDLGFQENFQFNLFSLAAFGSSTSQNDPLRAQLIAYYHDPVLADIVSYMFLRPVYIRQWLIYGESPNFLVGGNSYFYPSEFDYDDKLLKQQDVNFHFPSDPTNDGYVAPVNQQLVDNALLQAILGLLTNQGENNNYYYNYYNNYESNVESIWKDYWDGSNEDIDTALSGLQNTLMSLRNIPLLFQTALDNFFPSYILNTIYFVIMLALVIIILCLVRRFI